MLRVTFDQAYPMAVRASQVRARRLVLSGAVAPYDCEELEQEGLFACWRALPRFDATRGLLKTYLEHVIANQFASLGRARRCRPRLQQIGHDDCRVGATWAGGVELRADIHRVLGALQGGDRLIALMLMEHTPTEASRRLGISRSSLHARIQRIRTVFEAAGLGPRGVVQ
jgi:DNA-directed RNA polymerase specialized sigma24 family protein